MRPRKKYSGKAFPGVRVRPSVLPVPPGPYPTFLLGSSRDVLGDTIASRRPYHLVGKEIESGSPGFTLADFEFPLLVELDRIEKYLPTKRQSSCLRVLKNLCDVLGNSSLDSFQGTLSRGFVKKMYELTSEESIQWLVKESSLARQRWVESGGRHEYAQISYVKRALPVATAQQGATALVEHQERLLSVFTSRKSDLLELESEVIRFCRRHYRKDKGILSSGIPNLSSCSDLPLREGGFRNYVSSLPEHPRAREFCSRVGRFEDLPVQDQTSLVRDTSLQLTAFEVAYGLRPGFLPSKVHVLLERGLKTRVITKSSFSLLLLGHGPRRKLLRGLRKNPAFSVPLQEGVDKRLSEYFTGACCEVVLSTDLTAATDLFPSDMVATYFNGIKLSGLFSEFELYQMWSCLRPQLIEFSDGEIHLSKRGILMGLPMTWVSLSIIHYCWWQMALRRVCHQRRLALRTGRQYNRFLICGDDAIFVGWKEVAEEYNKILSSFGAQVSAGKHFLSCTKPYRGNFIERLYEFHVEGGLVTSVTRDPSIPLRGLSQPSSCGTLQTFLGHKSCLKVPESLAMLMVCSSIWTSHPSGVQRLLNFVERNSSLRRYARSLGFRDGAPLHLGGSGLPSMKVSRRVEATAGLIQALPKPDRLKLPSMVRGITDPLWNLSVTLSDCDFEGFLGDATFVIGGDYPPAEPGVFFFEQEEDPLGAYFYRSVPCGATAFKEQAQASAYEDLTLSIGSPPGGHWVKSLSPKLFSEKLREFFSSIRKIGSAIAAGSYQFRDDSIAVRLTKSGLVRLFPKWFGPNCASEARLRKEVYSSFLGSIAHGHYRLPQGGGDSEAGTPVTQLRVELP
nr:MAG: RNA-dependent RNA polymerase [Narnaviridae sp.]